MPTITTDQPLKKAVDAMSRKTVTPSGMTSAQWELVQAEIRFRAMFSARVEDERILAEMQRRLQARIELAKSDGRTMDRGVFIEEMREELRTTGYKRPDGVKRGSLRDLKGSRRLGLIWDMNLSQAQGYARWKADMTPEGLENEPCYELIRGMERIEHRPWPVIWSQHGGEFYDGEGSNDDYPNSPGRMMAKKTSGIWRAISRFGTPWTPLDWGSGMVLRGVSREESDAFGITTPDEKLEPQDEPFNIGLKASVAEIPDAGRARLLDAFQGEVELVEDELRVLPPPADVPKVVVFPSALTAQFRIAAETLANWSEEKLVKFSAALEETTAWPRYRAALGDTPTHEALVRAMAQFIAGPDGKDAIAQVRRTNSRDAFWCLADFFGIAAFLAGEVLS